MPYVGSSTFYFSYDLTYTDNIIIKSLRGEKYNNYRIKISVISKTYKVYLIAKLIYVSPTLKLSKNQFE